MTVFIFNKIELIGYAGGIFLAFAALPQVIHTYKTQSTGDISYAWLITTLIGLSLDYVYFLLSSVTAAWITLSFELSFVFLIFFMKVRIDGLGPIKKRGSVFTKSADSSVQLSDEESATGDASSSDAEDDEAYITQGVVGVSGGSQHHVLLKAHVSNNSGRLPAKFAETLRSAVDDMAARQGLPVDYLHMDAANLSQQPDENVPSTGHQQRFAMSVELDQSFLSAYWNANKGVLLMDYHHFNTDADQAIVQELFAFLQNQVSQSTRLIVQQRS